MAEMLVADSIKELRSLIDQQHLIYLELDESPRKIDQRNKLEGYIREYLYLTPHDTKFSYHQTADVLHLSAFTKNNFSAYKAGVAWKAIGKYADNLISHPWRKEYRDIKLYCGFYKYEIEGSLAGAELMFEAMGYRHTGHSSMVLPGILDPDRITSVSKDAILAFVECQIMKQIWEALSPRYNISWSEILEFRENHTGTPEQVIRTLTYKHRQRQYEDQSYYKSPQLRAIDSHIPPPECPYGHSSLGYYNHLQYQNHSYSLPVQNRYGPVISSQHMVSSPIYPIHAAYGSHTLKPQEVYPTNSIPEHSHYPSLSLQHFAHNGFSVAPLVYSVPSVVPTGQLIELDSAPNCLDRELCSQKPPNVTTYNIPQSESVRDSLQNDETTLSSKARDDGVGSSENWDYVYRNLESHGYKKDLCSSEDILLKQSHTFSSQSNSDYELSNTNQNSLSDRLKKINIDSNSNSQGKSDSSSLKGLSDLDVEPKSKNFKEKSRLDFEISKDQNKTRVDSKLFKSSPEKTKKENKKMLESSSKNVVHANKNGSFKNNNELPVVQKESVKSKTQKDDSHIFKSNEDDTQTKWQCITCTFLNSSSNNVCEMCYKSKERGSELTPQPSGGQECPKCTLVNVPGLSHCAACNMSLKGSPTYI